MMTSGSAVVIRGLELSCVVQLMWLCGRCAYMTNIIFNNSFIQERRLSAAQQRYVLALVYLAYSRHSRCPDVPRAYKSVKSN